MLVHFSILRVQWLALCIAGVELDWWFRCFGWSSHDTILYVVFFILKSDLALRQAYANMDFNSNHIWRFVPPLDYKYYNDLCKINWIVVIEGASLPITVITLFQIVVSCSSDHSIDCTVLSFSLVCSPATVLCSALLEGLQHYYNH